MLTHRVVFLLALDGCTIDARCLASHDTALALPFSLGGSLPLYDRGLVSYFSSTARSSLGTHPIQLFSISSGLVAVCALTSLSLETRSLFP